MANDAGKRLMCQSCGAEIVVTRGGDGSVTSCGEPMVLKDGAVKAASPGGETMLKVGRRYRCEGCGTEVLVTKAAGKLLSCCAADMEAVEPKKTASAD